VITGKEPLLRALENFRPNLPGFFYHPTPSREPLKQAIELINRSERPVIFCVHGVAGSRFMKHHKRIYDISGIASRQNLPVFL